MYLDSHQSPESTTSTDIGKKPRRNRTTFTTGTKVGLHLQKPNFEIYFQL